MAKTGVQFFNPKDIGASLSEISAEFVRAEDHEISSRWFHSAKDSDLFIWQDDNQNIIKQQLTMGGQIVEWNALEGLKTGFVIDEGDSKRSIPASDVIKFDETAQPQVRALAISILQHIVVETDLKAQLIANFERGDRQLGLGVRTSFRRTRSSGSRMARIKKSLQRLFKVK